MTQFTATQIHNLNISCEEVTCNNLYTGTQNIGATVNRSLLMHVGVSGFLCHIAMVTDTSRFPPVPAVVVLIYLRW